MVFNGSKQSCPNYEGGDLDLSWDIYNDNLNGIEPDLRRKYNKTCLKQITQKNTLLFLKKKAPKHIYIWKSFKKLTKQKKRKIEN